jgi:hypothetical protein
MVFSISSLAGSQAYLSCFQGAHLAQTTHVPLSIAEFGCQECFNEIPSNRRSHSPAAHTDNVHVIVLDSLLGREVVVDQTGTNTYNLIGTNGRTNAAATDCHATLYVAGGDSLRERNDEIGVVVGGVKAVSAEIHYLMAGCTKLGNKFFFQAESTVIGGDSDPHIFLLNRVGSRC